MKKILLLLMLALTGNSFANQISPETTQELLTLCDSVKPEEVEKCSGYIWGVGDALFAGQAMEGRHVQYDISVSRYSELSPLIVQKAIKVIVNYEPKKANYPPVTIVIEAFQLLDVWKYKNEKWTHEIAKT